MARPRIGKDPLTGAEKQKRYRQRQKEAGLKHRDIWVTTGEDSHKALEAQELAIMRKQIEREVRQELEESWEPIAKRARITEVRVIARKKAKIIFNEISYHIGICYAAAAIIPSYRDIAKGLLKYFKIDEVMAAELLSLYNREKVFKKLKEAEVWEDDHTI